MNEDIIEIEILEDGTIKTSTDQIGQSNHQNAEEFMAEMARNLGGATETEKRRVSHAHAHTHQHAGGHR